MTAELAADDGDARPAVQYLRRVPGIDRRRRVPRSLGRHGAPPGAGRLGPDLPAQRHGQRTGGRDQAEPDGGGAQRPDADPAAVGPSPRPASWTGASGRTTQTERIHQSRVAMRRIRSNLRTFRLLLDPTWGTSLRAELAWYGNCLGQARDLHILRDLVTDQGRRGHRPGRRSSSSSRWWRERMAGALVAISAERGGARRFQLTEQMMVLWDGPAFKAKATKPAAEVLPRDAPPGLARPAGRGPHAPGRTRPTTTCTSCGSG